MRKQQPFLVHDLAQHLQVQVVQELRQGIGGPPILVRFGEHWVGAIDELRGSSA